MALSSEPNEQLAQLQKVRPDLLLSRAWVTNLYKSITKYLDGQNPPSN